MKRERSFDWKGMVRSKRMILNATLSLGLTVAVAINIDLRRDLRQYRTTNQHFLDSLIVKRLTPRVYVFIVTPEKVPVPVDPDSAQVQLETYLDLAPWPWMRKRKATP